MIRTFWLECRSATDLLALICNRCEFLAADLNALAIGASAAEIENMRKRFYLIEDLVRELNRQIRSLRKYSGHSVRLEGLPLIGDVWRIQPACNPWLTERQETNRIDFVAQKKMLAIQALFRRFILANQREAFPVTHVHEMSSYEKLLYKFSKDKLRWPEIKKPD